MAGEKDKKPTTRKSKGKSRKQSRERKRGSRKPLLNHRHMHALAKELRVRALAILCERVASPNEISKLLNEGLGTVSYHVSVLEKCGLIVLDHEKPVRGAMEHFYRAVYPTLIPPGSWKHLPPSVRKGVSASILRVFFDDASAAMKAGIFDDEPGELGWTPLILDAEGIEAYGKLARDFLASVLELQAKANGRLSEGGGDAKAATAFLATFFSVRSPKDGKKASAAKRR